MLREHDMAEYFQQIKAILTERSTNFSEVEVHGLFILAINRSSAKYIPVKTSIQAQY
jgi:hypothetical protein